ncbi:MAG: bifunctional phosphopantothenoylcysteine decarboxylase/phosphopantothenate--cysteine ligase CoaBC [Christensenellaceae bacterium]|nr:bifunctional phosphopantothenoylcysteine decarboxylase/phosphopantothenate--cysteine ligase CoaBC [Christensenellaceae bacterium]
MSLSGRRIVLAVTGGIAAYKSATITSLLKKSGADVKVAMTENACRFISPITFETLSKNAVVTDTFDRSRPYDVEHISTAKFAEVIIVAPATANMIAKAAHGIADDFISTMLLAATCPVVFAPAMNTAMYNNPATQENLSVLKSRGTLFIEPGSGLLACGDVGSGRMCEPEEIVEYIDRLLNKRNDLSGKNVLITAGPTIEDIDDVRYLTNRSSGKMGYALAQAAISRGAEVTLISGPVYITPPAGAKVINIRSAKGMKEAVLEHAASADIIIKAAAVADYTPKTKYDGKIKKSGDMTLELTRTVDIMAELGKLKSHQILVGFAAEAADLINNAQGKLEKKNMDLICANDISRSDIGFAGDQNALSLLFRDGRTEQINKCSKQEAADLILDAILTIK